MSSMNKVFLLGRLGQDPEMRYTASQEPVTNFSMATSTVSSKSGERKEYTEWHRCCAFNKAAEVAGQYLRKGSQVLVEGSLRTRKWQDKEGKDQYTTEIVVGRLTMLGRASETEEEAPAPKAKPAGKKSAAEPTFDDLDEEIPF